jgi:hypothetical protein
MSGMIRTLLIEQKAIYDGQIEQLINERDEARRMYCRQTADSLENYREPERIADDRGWNCFSKENVK